MKRRARELDPIVSQSRGREGLKMLSNVNSSDRKSQVCLVHTFCREAPPIVDIFALVSIR